MDPAAMMQQFQKFQSDLKKVQSDLAKRTVVGESAAGMVKAYANGQQEFLKIEIDPEAVDPSDLGMLEDLVLVAIKNCLAKSKELSEEEMSRVTAGMNLPGGLAGIPGLSGLF